MLLFLSVEARRVDVEKAEKVARSYARTTSQLSLRKDFRLSKTVTKRVTRQRPAVQSANPQHQDEPMFYVFAMNGNGGFIIVSGDDVAKPVLGYSDDGTYDENNPNLAYWMETLSQEIAVAVENSASQDKLIKAQWEAFENDEPVRASGDYVAPLVQTKWSQVKPYNNLCPKISGTTVATGCVATAMAQIMKFHRYPATRTVTIPGYTTGTRKISIPEIAGSTTYGWDNMADTYSRTSTNTVVAELMYHCGVSVEMDYDTDVSGAYSSDVADALNTYFGYDAGTACHYRNYCSNPEWIDLLKTEIKAKRPVYYDGTNVDGAHAFVCDGYNSDDKFHFNWGWNGDSDGYFEVSALIDGYNQDQSIITGIQPDRGGQPINTVKLGLSTFYSDKTSLNSLTESFNVTAGELENIGTGTVMFIYLGVLLYGEDGYCDYITVRRSLSPGFPSGNVYPTLNLLLNYSLPSGLPAGTYKLYPAYSVSDETPSIIPEVKGTRYIGVIVAGDGSVTLSEGSEPFHVNARTPTVTEQPKPAVYISGATATALSVMANVTDGGTLSYQWYCNTGNSNNGWTEINNATQANYTPSTATVGTAYYYVKVTSTSIPCSQTASITSDVAKITVIIEKASQPAPDAPVLVSKNAISVTLTAVSDNVEYSLDGATWQDSPIFDGLIPDSEYFFYARMKETDTHNASPPSGYLQVRTDVAEADLLSLTVNGNSISIEGNELDYYQAECDETSVMLGIELSVSASATVTVGNDSIKNGIVPLSKDLTVINIHIVSGDGGKSADYRLTVANPLDAGAILFQRWNDVIAVNSNQKNNGGRVIEDIRWYAVNSTNVVSSERFIPISGDATDYRAEIKIADKWHHVCGTAEQHSKSIAAYPNPVSTGENLILQLSENFTVGYMNVISLSGLTVKHKLPLPDAVNTVSVADWSPGIYLLNIVAPDGSQELVKIIVSN
jgi:hypothetical protein